MRNLSFDQFCRKIKGKILLVGGYTEDFDLINIIKDCRLKPISAFSNNFNKATTLELVWVDEFDNNIEIKNKKAKINLKTKQIQNTTTDIFKNSGVKFITSHSSIACIGLYPNTENFILLLRGTDNYFRCYVCQNDQVSICSPLTVGLRVLKQCYSKQLKYFKKLSIKSEIKNLKEVEWFITALPASKLLSLHILTYNKLRDIIYNE